MTGKHAGYQSIRGNQPTPHLILDDEPSLANVIKGGGYKTAVIGKRSIGHPILLDDPKKWIRLFVRILNL